MFFAVHKKDGLLAGRADNLESLCRSIKYHYGLNTSPSEFYVYEVFSNGARVRKIQENEYTEAVFRFK